MSGTKLAGRAANESVNDDYDGHATKRWRKHLNAGTRESGTGTGGNRKKQHHSHGERGQKRVVRNRNAAATEETKKERRGRQRAIRAHSNIAASRTEADETTADAGDVTGTVDLDEWRKEEEEERYNSKASAKLGGSGKDCNNSLAEVIHRGGECGEDEESQESVGGKHQGKEAGRKSSLGSKGGRRVTKGSKRRNKHRKKLGGGSVFEAESGNNQKPKTKANRGGGINARGESSSITERSSKQIEADGTDSAACQRRVSVKEGTARNNKTQANRGGGINTRGEGSSRRKQVDKQVEADGANGAACQVVMRGNN